MDSMQPVAYVNIHRKRTNRHNANKNGGLQTRELKNVYANDIRGRFFFTDVWHIKQTPN